MLRGFIRIWNASEILDLSSSRFLVEAFHVSALTNVKWGVDEALIEGKAWLLVDLTAKLAVLGIRWYEGDKADLAWEGKQLGDFWYSADVLSSVFCCESKVLIEPSSDNITIKNEAFAGVPKHLV
jgi:hypothetical protein